MDDLNKLSKSELIERLNTQTAAATLDVTSDYEREMRIISQKTQDNNPHNIPIRVFADHKNIMLYTAINKPVGPLAPDNARSTMERWKKAGIQLYTSKRTPEQVEAFKQTAEYKTHLLKHEATRKQRRAQSTKGKTEAMIKEVAALTAAAVAGAKAGSNA